MYGGLFYFTHGRKTHLTSKVYFYNINKAQNYKVPSINGCPLGLMLLPEPLNTVNRFSLNLNANAITQRHAAPKVLYLHNGRCLEPRPPVKSVYITVLT